MKKPVGGLWRSLSDNGALSVVSAVTATSTSSAAIAKCPRSTAGSIAGGAHDRCSPEDAFVAGAAAVVDTIGVPALLLRHTARRTFALRHNSHARLFFSLDAHPNNADTFDTPALAVSSAVVVPSVLNQLDAHIDGLSEWLFDALEVGGDGTVAKHFDGASATLAFLALPPQFNFGATFALLTVQPVPIFNAPTTMHASRYESDFEELECIGRGGFGTVFRVRNKLDGQEYAVKKIKCNSVTRLKTEVQTLARLSSHPNIIRYYAAWTEPILFSNTTTHDDGDDFDCDTSSSGFSSQDSDLLFDDAMFGARHASFPSRRRSLARVTQKNASSPALMLNVSSSIQEEQHLMNSINRSRRRRQKQYHRRRSCSTSSKPTSILYIQMQLCPSTDLRRYLQSLSGTQVLSQTQLTTHINIFHQIVSALSFLHQNNIVHLDIKPDNIFLTPFYHVFLGDFGLAQSIIFPSTSSTSSIRPPLKIDSPPDTPPFPLDLSSLDRLSESDTVGGKSSTLIASHSHSSSNGTYLYAAPDHTLTMASDVYALGIILVELMNPFATVMERAKVLTKVKVTGDPPEEMEIGGGGVKEEVWKLCARCLKSKAAERPSCEEIVKEVEAWL